MHIAEQEVHCIYRESMVCTVMVDTFGLTGRGRSRSTGMGSPWHAGMSPDTLGGPTAGSSGPAHHLSASISPAHWAKRPSVLFPNASSAFPPPAPALCPPLPFARCLQVLPHLTQLTSPPPSSGSKLNSPGPLCACMQAVLTSCLLSGRRNFKVPAEMFSVPSPPPSTFWGSPCIWEGLMPSVRPQGADPSLTCPMPSCSR